MTTTRSQQDLQLALELVSGVEKNADVRKVYGGLCHQFPVMVRTVGLAQTLAFHESKASAGGDRGRAHTALLSHVAKLLGSTRDSLLRDVQGQPTAEYLHATRRILGAWIYFKRFAVSVLKVQSGQDAEGDT